MSLPDGFNDYEHLQSILRQVHNRMVRDAFSDLGGDEWDPDIITPRASLRTACTIKDEDNIAVFNQRMWLFFLHLRQGRDLMPAIIGQTKGAYDADRKYHPQIWLFFLEDSGDVEEGYSPVEGTISYRLMNETASTISKSELTAIGQKIKAEFGAANGYIWKKGKDMASYTDKANGFQFQLLVRSKSDAKEIISKVLDTNNKTPDWKFLNYKENDSPSTAYPTIPGNLNILGETQKEPRMRPIASCRFQYAFANVWGSRREICLYDRTYSYLDALVEA